MKAVYTRWSLAVMMSRRRKRRQCGAHVASACRRQLPRARL